MDNLNLWLVNFKLFLLKHHKLLNFIKFLIDGLSSSYVELKKLIRLSMYKNNLNHFAVATFRIFLL